MNEIHKIRVHDDQMEEEIEYQSPATYSHQPTIIKHKRYKFKLAEIYIYGQ